MALHHAQLSQSEQRLVIILSKTSRHALYKGENKIKWCTGLHSEMYTSKTLFGVVFTSV